MKTKQMRRSQVSGIYAITPETEDTGELLANVSTALTGGVRLFQYRNKTGSDQLRREQCQALLDLVSACDGILIVNDSAGLASEVNAHGVHLGKDDESVADARQKLGPDKIIGASCYNDLARAHALQAAGVDYVAFGSFFQSVTKPAAVSATVDLLSRAKSELEVPVVAIGGINRDNAAMLIEAGADALAVVSGLFSVNDVEQEARILLSLINRHRLQVH